MRTSGGPVKTVIRISCEANSWDILVVERGVRNCEDLSSNLSHNGVQYELLTLILASSGPTSLTLSNFVK